MKRFLVVPIGELLVLLLIVAVVCLVAPHLPDVHEMGQQYVRDQANLKFEPPLNVCRSE